jgi:hypothetical protein
VSSAPTPELALAYLRELQPGIGDVALGAPGDPLAGVHGVVRVRSGNLEIAVVPGPIALPGLLVHDAERVLELTNR